MCLFVNSFQVIGLQAPYLVIGLMGTASQVRATTDGDIHLKMSSQLPCCVWTSRDKDGLLCTVLSPS